MIKTKEFSRLVISLYKKTKKELEDVEQIKISGDNMINVDVNKTIKAMFYQRVDELLIKKGGIRNGKR